MCSNNVWWICWLSKLARQLPDLSKTLWSFNGKTSWNLLFTWRSILCISCWPVIWFSISASFFQKFWDWSWQEYALYDLQEMIRYVYTVTNSRVFVIGYSQVFNLMIAWVFIYCVQDDMVVCDISASFVLDREQSFLWLPLLNQIQYKWLEQLRFFVL